MQPETLDVEGDLEWSVHLARARPARLLATLACTVLAAAAAYALFRHPLPALLAAALLVLALGDFLFPVRYRLSPAGAEIRGVGHWRRITWEEVKRVYVGEEEVKLSPLAHGGPREPFRGVLLRCEGNRDAVLAAVRRFRHAAAGDRSHAR